jgi:hypothetical protein
MSLRIRLVAVTGALALVVAGVAAGIAVGAASAGRTTAAGGVVDKVNVVRSTEIFNTSTKTFKTIPGASTQITVPAGEHALLIARFTTQQDCTVGDGNPSGTCIARLLANTSEMKPASGGQILDTVSNGAPAGVRAGALDRSFGPVGSGTYTIKVQVRVTSSLMILEVTDWHLTVERVHVSG